MAPDSWYVLIYSFLSIRLWIGYLCSFLAFALTTLVVVLNALVRG